MLQNVTFFLTVKCYNIQQGAFMKNYIINKETLALISELDGTRIYEKNTNFFVNLSPNNIIKSSCLFYGCSFEGRLNGTKYILGLKSKIPIIINEKNNIIFFPTDSIRKSSCNWLSLNNINNCQKNAKNTKILFFNGIELSLNISKYIIDNQILRASRLQMLINQRN